MGGGGGGREVEEGGEGRCTETDEECARRIPKTLMRLFSEVDETKPLLPPATQTPPTTPTPSQFLQQMGVVPFPHLPQTPTNYTTTFPSTPPPTLTSRRKPSHYVSLCDAR